MPSIEVAIPVLFALGFVLGSLGLWALDGVRLNEARGLVERGAPLVDVGAADVFALDHLKRAINIPLDELERRATELDRGRPVVVYGRGLLRAARAARALRQLGFHQVVALGTFTRARSAFEV